MKVGQQICVLQQECTVMRWFSGRSRWDPECNHPYIRMRKVGFCVASLYALYAELRRFGCCESVLTPAHLRSDGIVAAHQFAAVTADVRLLQVDWGQQQEVPQQPRQQDSLAVQAACRCTTSQVMTITARSIRQKQLGSLAR